MAIKLPNGIILRIVTGSGAFGSDGKGGGQPPKELAIALGIIESNFPSESGVAITLKTITKNPKKGNSRLPWPLNSILPIDTIKISRGTVVNNVGLQNPGITKWKERYGATVTEIGREQILIGSITADNVYDFLFLAQELDGYPLAALELNLSCPNIKNNFPSIESATDICFILEQATHLPLILKLAYDPHAQYLEIAKAAAGTYEAVSINSVAYRYVYPGNTGPFGDPTTGGVSGKKAQKYTWEVAQKIANEDIPVIIPSIMSWADFKTVRELFKGRAWTPSVSSLQLVNPPLANRMLRYFATQ